MPGLLARRLRNATRGVVGSTDTTPHQFNTLARPYSQSNQLACGVSKLETPSRSASWLGGTCLYDGPQKRTRARSIHTSLPAAGREPSLQVPDDNADLGQIKNVLKPQLQQLSVDGWKYVPVGRRRQGVGKPVYRKEAVAAESPTTEASEFSPAPGQGEPRPAQLTRSGTAAAPSSVQAVASSAPSSSGPRTLPEAPVPSTSGSNRGYPTEIKERIEAHTRSQRRWKREGRRNQVVYDQIQVAGDKDVATLARSILTQLAADTACFVAATKFSDWQTALQGVTTARKLANRIGKFDLVVVPEAAMSLGNGSSNTRGKLQLYVRRTAPSPVSMENLTVLTGPWPSSPEDLGQLILTSLSTGSPITLRCGGSNLSVDAIRGLLAARKLLRQHGQDIAVAPQWFVEVDPDGKRAARMDLVTSSVQRVQRF